MKTIDIAKLISNRHSNKATGGLFLLDNDKKLLQIYFVSGEMVSIKTRNLSGRDALTELLTMKPIKFQFHEGAETKNTHQLPSTAEIVKELLDTKTVSDKQKLLPDHIEEQARELFIDYVGPIADVIFEEQIEHSQSLDHLIQTLSSYIDDDKDKNSFIQSAKTIAEV